MKNCLFHRLAPGCVLIASFAALSGCGGSSSPGASIGSSGSSGSGSTYTIGGKIQGLTGSGLVLVNGSDTLKVSANATSFTMPTAVTNGTAYDVTVQTHPTAISCAVISGAGTVTGANVTSISVSCQPGTESILYSFTGGTDGVNPQGSLIQASDGNFYGTTRGGGSTSNYGTVFKITPSGTETVLYSFKGGTDGANPDGSLIQASDGNFYGTTHGGGGTGNDGTVFKITSSGTESVLYSFKGGTEVVPTRRTS